MTCSGCGATATKPRSPDCLCVPTDDTGSPMPAPRDTTHAVASSSVSARSFQVAAAQLQIAIEKLASDCETEINVIDVPIRKLQLSCYEAALKALRAQFEFGRQADATDNIDRMMRAMDRITEYRNGGAN